VKAVLSTEQRERLPDSAYACPEKRLYPHHFASGRLDLVHLRNALSRVNQAGTDSCGKAHLEAHAREEGMGDRPAKATVLDDDHFRLLAIPFGGPLKGRDLDGEFFSPRTDIMPDLFPARPVFWHHGYDATMGRTVLGKADNLTLEEDGWWVDVWLRQGEKRVELIRRLAEKGGTIFGSTAPLATMVRKASNGEILIWPYAEQTLSTSPQNTYSVLRPAKAALDFQLAEIPVTDSLWALLTRLDALSGDLSPTSRGEGMAKAGRVLSSRNEKALREALASLERVLSQLRKEEGAEAIADRIEAHLNT
jgi:hypothetical protein